MKTKLNNNIEIYNYLNITNRKLGKLYKYTGTHCLPTDFDVNEDSFKERIILNEMQNQDIFPPYIHEEKKVIKKQIKNSIKNIQKFKKFAKNSAFLQNFSQKFVKKLSLYFDLRHELTHALLKDFESQDCDEVELYRQVFNLDPVFGPYMDCLFEQKPDFEALLQGLEEKYDKSYFEKLQILEKKNQRRKKKSAQQELQNENLKNVQKTKKTTRSKIKNDDKVAKNTQKLQNLEDAKKVRTENKEKLSEQKVAIKTSKSAKDKTK